MKMHGNFIQLSRIVRVERMKRPPKIMNIFPALTRVYSHLFFQILGGGSGNGGSVAAVAVLAVPIQ